MTDPLRDVRPGETVIRTGDPAGSPLQPYGGSLTREKPVLELQAGTWGARAKVTPITGLRGRGAAGRRFEVSVSWHGPPMENSGLPRLAPGQKVDAEDTVMVANLELAKAIAMRAIDTIRQHRVPDLRLLQRLLAPTL